MAPSEHHHRATLKQSNKPYKSKHSSKGSLKAAAKGKTDAPAKLSSKSSQLGGQTKLARLNAQAQKRALKAKSVNEDVKFFSTSSSGSGAPRIVSVVPLLPSSSVSPARWLRDLLPSLGLSEGKIEETLGHLRSAGNVGTYLLRAPRFKTTLQINLLPSLDVYASLDAALISDYVVLLLSSKDEVQLDGEGVLRCLQGQAGGVEVVSCVQAPEDDPIQPSTKNLIHKSLLSFTRYFFPAVEKIHSADTTNESALLARALCEAAPSTTRSEGDRAYIVAEGSNAVRFTPTVSDDVGRLEVTGTIRGGRLSADRLVHLPGRGDFQVESICAAGPSSITLDAKPHQRAAMMAVEEPQAALSTPGEDADDLTATNTPDLMANEQTWPTEDDMSSAPALVDSGKRTKRVPKGTSAYQAAWIFDDEDEDDDDDEDEDDEDMDEDGELDDEEEDAESGGLIDEDEETEEIELDSRKGDAYRDLDPDQEEQEYAEYLKQREKAAEEDMMFPDEIDTPRHVAARTRFQRYRGLKSFRTSPWDPYENLPVDYGRIFQFENYGATKKRVERESREEGVKPGTRVTVVLKDIPRSLFESIDPRLPFILHGLLQHEHKQSVLHFIVQRNTEYTEPVKAKEPLVLCVGPRRYVIRPLYSQHVRGGGKGANNVHKSEKFLRPGAATVATTYGPTCFGKAACLLLKDASVVNDESAPTGPSRPELVAMGTFMSPDPTRIIAKRIILTGHPFKVHKKTATIRYMFFDRDDIDWFKSIELHTKFGRVGHIQEPLGTHGYFKAHFDGPIQQMDTVCMNLYKRQFPKWSEEFKPSQQRSSEPAPEMDLD